MIGNHSKLPSDGTKPTAKDLYEAMAAMCCSYELLLKNKTAVDPTSYEKTQDIPFERILQIIEKHYQWARDAALAVGFDIAWPGVPPVQQVNEDSEGDQQ